MKKIFYLIPLTITCLSGTSLITSCGCKHEDKIQFNKDANITINNLVENENDISFNYSVSDNENIRYCIDDLNSKIKVTYLDKTVKEFSLYNCLEACANIPENKLKFECDTKNIFKIIFELKSISLNDWCNRYCEMYQPDYINNLTFAEHDYWKATCKDFHCKSMAEAVFTWAHNAGYEVWNTRLHEDKGTSGLDVPNAHEIKGMNTPESWIDGDVLYGDYKYLDQALKLSKSNQKINVFHGFEPNECDLVEFINTTLGCDIEKQSVEEIKKIDLSKIKNKSYVNYGYCATSFGKRTAQEWVSGSSYNTVPFLDLKLDKNIYGAYISYTKTYKHQCKYGDNWALAFPDELQFLIYRNSTIRFDNCYFTTIGNKNVLYIDATVVSN